MRFIFRNTQPRVILNTYKCFSTLVLYFISASVINACERFIEASERLNVAVIMDPFTSVFSNGSTWNGVENLLTFGCLGKTRSLTENLCGLP